MKITTFLASLMISAAPVFALDIMPVMEASEISVDHPYHILEMRPGMIFEEIEEVAASRNLDLIGKRARYSIGSDVNGSTLTFVVGFESQNPNDPYLLSNVPGWERIKGNMSTDAAGNVAVQITREISLDPETAPSADAVFGQVIAEFGEPTIYREMVGQGRSGFWLHDPKGAKLMPGSISEMPSSCISNGMFEYVSAAVEPTECSVMYAMNYKRGDDVIEIMFTLIDFTLRDADRFEASRQIDAFLSQDRPGSKIDF